MNPNLPDSPTTETPTPDDAATRRAHHGALAIVFLVVFIDLLGFGIVLPLLPRYADRFLDEVIPGGQHSALSGLVLGLLYSCFSIMQFVFAPIWGRISDRVGRRPILLLGLLGSVIFYVLFAVASDLGGTIGLALLFVARLGQGVAGATIATAQAVIADSTTPERRSRGMALIGAAFGIGFTFGPLLGLASIVLWSFFAGVSERDVPLGVPGYMAAALSLAALLLGLRLLPETLRPDSAAAHRRWLNWSGLRLALRTPTINILILIFFLITFAFASFEATVSLLIRDVLAYGDKNNFWMFAYIGFILLVTQGGLYQMLARRGVTEATFTMMGLGLLVVGMAGLGGAAWLASQPEPYGHGVLRTWMLAVLALAVMGFAFVTPSVQALISRRSPATQQGEILGVNQSGSALARILGPLIGLWIYKLEPTHMLTYALATVLLLLLLPLMPRLRQA
ncbi:MAG: MFS transporter [Gemmataceae bacterium]